MAPIDFCLRKWKGTLWSPMLVYARVELVGSLVE
jgi:hypothetical protein